MSFIPPPDKKHYYEQVWAIVRQIPFGKVVTYGQITTLIPKPEGVDTDDYKLSAARWTGMAMSACPDDVPWQRVVNSQGKISHQAEPGKQKHLLEAEGVEFIREKIDLSQFQWRGPGKSDEPQQGRLF